MDTSGKYYLGRIFDMKKGEVTKTPLLYDPDDLTTHAVVVGMTGSGKTGLCIDLLEEAALGKLPAVMIDPKGDITNALLHFPDLLPKDFQPWINPDQVRREGKTIDQVAESTAALWKKGLADWDITGDRIRQLKNSVDFAIYTPGSDAGLPVSILASFEAPPIPWEENSELLREKISSTSTALLGLVGIKNVDPVRSREHILLSNIFEYAWSQKMDLDLSELILQTQNPPFSKLGVFDVNTFFPQKDRFELAMMLNNILAAPAFQTWIEGQPLDISKLLYSSNGKPRHSVFYIAHLTDEERMFFVTLLYSAVETWMRAQSGTSSLRAILYFDEIFGYLPPVSNPPSKESMLRMLKQARAFGVGQVLVTQNPVDIDYKALSNAGTWFIGKLQTDQDKQRLLDGLEGIMAGEFDRREFDRLISALGKRVFLMKNVHEREPQVFSTRWAMNYLAGPLTRNQIPLLNELYGEKTYQSATQRQISDGKKDVITKPAGESKARTRGGDRQIGSMTRPAVPSGVAEYFLPENLTVAQAMNAAGQQTSETLRTGEILYKPVLIAQATIRFLNRTYNLDFDQTRSVVVQDPDPRGIIRWEKYETNALDTRQLESKPDPQGRYSNLEAPMTDMRLLKALESDFVDWLYRSSETTVRYNESLDIYAGPQVSEGEFLELCNNKSEELMVKEIDKVTAVFDKKIEQIKVKIQREEEELHKDQAEHSHRRLEEWGTYAETAFSLFKGRKRSLSSSLSKRRMTAKARADLDESLKVIEEYKADISELEKDKSHAVADLNEKWKDQAARIKEISVNPLKKDIILSLFGVAWMPHHVFEMEGSFIELPAFQGES